MVSAFVERHHEMIQGEISCFDRVVITGSLPDIGHGQAMEAYLRYHKVLLKDYPRWAEPMRDEIRAHAERLAEEAGLSIEFIRTYKSFRKERRIKDILAERGGAPGLVHVFSAMEGCTSFRSWTDKTTGHTRLKPVQGKCLHYYFYFIDEAFGLMYLRVPTWAPFRLQVYLNGHHWPARRLGEAGIDHTLEDNAFIVIDDIDGAQRLSDDFDTRKLHRHLDRWARMFCPASRRFRAGYHWSIMQAEYATDVLFHRQAEFQPLYDQIARTAVHSVKADQVATFLGRRLTAANNDEIGNDFSTRIQGTRIRHSMGKSAIKMYDKFGLMLRVETTTNDVTFFKLHRWVEQRNGETVRKLAPLRKNIYSLPDLARLLRAANDRYLAFIASIDNPDAGWKAVDRIARPARDKKRSWRGFNLLMDKDYQLFLTLARGEWCISGFRARDLRARIASLTPSRTSSLLKRLRNHGLIKKVGRTYKYYLTKLGRSVIMTVLNIRETIVLPGLSTKPA